MISFLIYLAFVASQVKGLFITSGIAGLIIAGFVMLYTSISWSDNVKASLSRTLILIKLLPLPLVILFIGAITPTTRQAIMLIGIQSSINAIETKNSVSEKSIKLLEKQLDRFLEEKSEL